jgi:Methyltransferase domain
MADDNISPLERYVRHGVNEVIGWSGSNVSMLLLHPLLEIQDPHSRQFGAFEIGVHYGRYLIAMHNACDPGTRSMGLDLFADQTRNVDRSGRGNMDQAKSNIATHAREPELVELRQGDSLTWTEREIRETSDRFGGFRIVSIDGGHTHVHVVLDTILGSRVVHPGGFLVIDDFYNTNYPSVTEGVYSLLQSAQIAFVPFLVTRKKLFLCQIGFTDDYWGQLTAKARTEAFSGISTKVVKIAGYRCLSAWT